jgi:hypothetical protein
LGVKTIAEKLGERHEMNLFDNFPGKAKKYLPQRGVKHTISSNFLTDAFLFIERFDYLIVSESKVNRLFRAKAIVDLIMSLECSLKSLIISLSKDSEKPFEAYQNARKVNHDIDKLFNECSKRAKNRFQIPKRPCIFDDISALGIGSRYSLEIWLIRFNSDFKGIFLGKDLISRTIDNYNWGKNLRSEAVRFYKNASRALTRFLDPHAIRSGKRISIHNAELNQFVSEIKKVKSKKR